MLEFRNRIWGFWPQETSILRGRQLCNLKCSTTALCIVTFWQSLKEFIRYFSPWQCLASWSYENNSQYIIKDHGGTSSWWNSSSTFLNADFELEWHWRLLSIIWLWECLYKKPGSYKTWFYFLILSPFEKHPQTGSQKGGHQGNKGVNKSWKWLLCEPWYIL